MAKGRMINQKITMDKKINDLSNDTSRLGFTWLISFADVEGRTPGDPAIVKSLLFPRRLDITPEQVELFIQEWAAAGLIIWYEAEDDLWIQFPKFDDNQIGLRKNREAPSHIPAPSLRRNSGETPDELPVNLTEVKRTENNRVAEIFKFYSNNIAMLTPYIQDELGDTLDEYGFDWVMDAMKIAVENNARNMRYIRAVLDNRKNGKGPQKKELSTSELLDMKGY